MPFLASVVAVALVAGCGGSGRSSQPTVKHVGVKRTMIVGSSSMEPTLHCAQPGPGCEAATADTIVVESLAGGKPNRADLIVLHTPPEGSREVRRGRNVHRASDRTPGETVQEKNGQVYVDGDKLSES
jgi:signal peptidase I